MWKQWKAENPGGEHENLHFTENLMWKRVEG